MSNFPKINFQSTGLLLNPISLSQNKQINLQQNRITFFRILIFIGIISLFRFNSLAQTTLGNDEPFDYSSPSEYEIGGITVNGTQYLDEGAIISISGLSIGDKLMIPGDKISKAIENLWKQGLFADIKISSSKVIRADGLDKVPTIFLDITVQEKPRLSRFSFKGVNKSEADDIREKIILVKGKPVTENVKKNTYNTTKSYFLDKGFLNVTVEIKEQRDTILSNSVMLTIIVDKKEKIKINRIYFHGNEHISSGKLKRALKDTKEKNRMDVFKDIYQHMKWDSLGHLHPRKIIGTLGSPEKLYGYISSKTRMAIFTTSKYIDETYQSEKAGVIAKYTDAGYRDAKIMSDSIYRFDENSINIEIHVDEGRKYYFRNITWVGNTKYTSAELDALLGIKKGEIFSQAALDARLFMNPDGRDVSSLYLDDGYLFFSVIPVEVNVSNDSIDLEMRIYEGKQATINKILITGNTKTNDRVIVRELRTKPGQLFSRSDIIRSQRELAQLGYFDPEKLNVNPKPNPAEGTVDIEYIVEEKSTDQVELSGGWGAKQLVGTFGIKFGNFSGRNIFKKYAWTPLPSGDGQQLSIRAQTSGKYFQSYNASFVEPWLGGKKPNSLSVSGFHSVYTNGLKKDDTNRETLLITGGTVGFGWRLKFPDDYFSRFLEFSYNYYDINNYPGFIFTDGYANNINAALTFSRNSIDQPIFPRMGSQISISGQFTPPYSSFKNVDDYSKLTDQEKYKYIEYHKWKFNASWFQRLTSNTNCLVLNTRMKFGYLGSYNKDLGDSPVERFYLGGDGLSGGFLLDGREIVALRGYGDNYFTPRGQNSQGKYGYIGGTVFDKITFEFRYPISLNPSATIYVLSFAEGGNTTLKFSDFKPFNLKRSAGLGVRIFLPMFGQLGLDYGWGFDQGTPGDPNLKTKGQFHFSIGQSIE